MSNTWLSSDFHQKLHHYHRSQHDEVSRFIYDIDALDKHIETLQNQDVVKLWFAVKANPLSSVIKCIAKHGVNFDVASAGELTQVLGQEVSASRILNTGPAKSKKHFGEFLKQGVNTFVVESINQLRWLNEEAFKAKKSPNVLLRVQLQWQEGEKNPLGGNSLTPFGLGVAEWQTININDYPSVTINGLHIFQWGNMLSNEKMHSLWSQMVDPLVNLAKYLGFELEVLDLGGGLGIDYLQEGKSLSWSQILSDLQQIKQQAGVKELWLELGRYAVAACGYYMTNVVDKKTNYGQQQLVLSAGINHLLRPAITEQPFPVVLSRSSSEQTDEFHLHGPLCTSLDTLGKLPLPRDVDVGDSLIFGYAGAYGFTESMPFFLCHNVASELIYQHGNFSEIRAMEPANWYLR